MKVYANQIQQQLSKSLSGCYLIFGDEPFQIDDCRKKIKAQAKNQGFEEFIRLTEDDQFDWHDLTHHCQAMSLFAEKKLIELELTGSKVNKAASDVLKQIAPELGDETILVLFGPKLDASQTKSAWFKALDSKGLYVPVYDIDGHHLNRWLQQQLAEYGMSMDQDAQQYLLNFTAGNLLASYQEIQKLNLALGPQHINIDTIEKFVADQAKYTVFQLMDSLWANNPERCMAILQRLKLEELEPNILLWSFQKDLLLLSQLQACLSQNQAPKAIFDKNRIWKNKQAVYLNAANNIPATSMRASLKLLSEVDIAMKRFTEQCPYSMFAHIILLLSGYENIQGIQLPVSTS